jgi:hypothetical protein
MDTKYPVGFNVLGRKYTSRENAKAEKPASLRAGRRES